METWNLELTEKEFDFIKECIEICKNESLFNGLEKDELENLINKINISYDKE